MPPRSILLIKPGSLGDIIHALPVASALHAAWPEAKLTWMADPRWASLLADNPAIHDIHSFPRETFRGVRGAIRGIRWYRELSESSYDLVLDLQGLLRSALAAKLAGSSAIYGLADAREGAGLFYHKAAQTHPLQHAVDRYLRILTLLDLPIPAKVEFPIHAEEVSYVPIGKRYIVINTFARGGSKALANNAAIALFAETANLVSCPVLCVGQGVPVEGLPGSVRDLTNKTTLPQLAGLLKHAAFVVSVDSGPMHLAAALGVPLLGIHTWSDPRKVGPYSETAWIWQGGEIRQQSFHRPPDPEVPFTETSAREVAHFIKDRERRLPPGP